MADPAQGFRPNEMGQVPTCAREGCGHDVFAHTKGPRGCLPEDGGCACKSFVFRKGAMDTAPAAPSSLPK